jgi:hypothetical protein
MFPVIHISGICADVENLVIYVGGIWQWSSAMLFCDLEFGIFVCLRSRGVWIFPSFFQQAVNKFV